MELFQENPFTRKTTVSASRFIRPMHPKTEVKADATVISRMLSMGWIGQLKMDGHRAQIHIPADPKRPLHVFNRQGQLHKQLLSAAETTELRRLFAPKTDWTVIDAEWIKPKSKIYVFDYIKRDGELLNKLSYLERWKLLPRSFLSPIVSILGIFDTVEKCLDAYRLPDPDIEGLVFKSQTPGFHDNSIIRCRKRP